MRRIFYVALYALALFQGSPAVARPLALSHNESLEQRLFHHSELLTAIIEQENSPQFCGYHGFPQSYRLYQDVLRAVFEETLEIDVPEDFYFLRIPTDAVYAQHQDASHFLHQHRRPDLTPSLQTELVRLFILQPFKETFPEASMRWTSEEREQLWTSIAPFFLQIDHHSAIFWNAPLGQYSDVQTDSSVAAKLDRVFDSQHLPKSKIFLLERLRRYAAYSHPKKLPEPTPCFLLQAHVRKEEKQTVASFVQERLSNSGLMQTLILSLLEENRLSPRVMAYLVPIWDLRAPLQSQLLSLTPSLYSNLDSPSESSLYAFLENRSISGGDQHVIASLERFFEEVGLPKEAAQDIYAHGAAKLSQVEGETGCLLQFFDTSEDRTFFSRNSYACYPFGIPHLPPHAHQASQLRLLMTASGSLNPSSPLRMKRYDHLPPDVSASIVREMRAELRRLPQDQIRKSLYLKKLWVLWGASIHQNQNIALKA